jgi:hypothetical protein
VREAGCELNTIFGAEFVAITFDWTTAVASKSLVANSILMVKLNWG